MSIPHTTARPRTHSDTLPSAPHDDAPIPPHDDGSEMCVIGSEILDPDCIDGVTKILPPSAFFGLMPRTIQSVIVYLKSKGIAVDGVTILARLKEQGFAGISDAYDYMTRAVDSVPSAGNVTAYAQIVRDHWSRSEAISAYHGGMQGLLDGATVESVTATTTAALARLAPRDVAEEPEPLPLREDFPIDALPPLVADYIQAVADALPCAIETVALPLLPSLAAAIGNSRRIGLKDSWDEPAVVWTATILLSGKLKSPAHEKAVQFLTRRERKLIAKYKLDLRRYESEIEEYEIEKSRRKRNKLASGELPPPPEIPTCHRLTTGDTTVEALAALLADNERGLLVQRDELAGWFGSFDRYSNGSGGDLAAYLSMHRAGSMTIDRKTGQRVTHIERAAVSVTGTIQPGTIRRCLTAEYFESGLPARILLAMPDSPPRRWSEAIVEPAIESAMDDLFDRLLNLQMDAQLDDDGNEFHIPVVLPLSPVAKELWIAFYNEHAAEQEQLIDDRESSAWSKLEAYAARFALIFTLCRNPDATDIDSQSMADGIRLTRWFCHETKRVYAMLSETPAESKENALVSMIRDKFNGRITPRELYRTSRKYQPTEVAESALEELIKVGYGQWEAGDSTGGRPAMVFTLHDCRRVDSRQKPQNSKKNDTSVNVNTVNTLENDNPQPPDDDAIPLYLQEAAAEEETARQVDQESAI